MKDFKAIWKTLADKKQLTSMHFVQRAILIAMAAKSNASKEDIVHSLLQKYFSPVTNKNKLANGSVKYSGVRNLQYYLKYGTTVLNLPLDEVFETKEEIAEYKRLCAAINHNKLGRQYIYYFTTQEGLTAEQQGVQAGHVLFSLAYKLANENIVINPNETYFQWIGVKTDRELREIQKKYAHLGVQSFYEPDLNNKLTSIALKPILWNKRGDLMEYPLLTHNH